MIWTEWKIPHLVNRQKGLSIIEILLIVLDIASLLSSCLLELKKKVS